MYCVNVKRMEKPVKTEKLYRAIEVAKATGLSEGKINAFFSNKGISIKKGITLAQIVDVLDSKTRKDSGVRWNDVEEIIKRLADEYGIVVEFKSSMADENSEV